RPSESPLVGVPGSALEEAACVGVDQLPALGVDDHALVVGEALAVELDGLGWNARNAVGRIAALEHALGDAELGIAVVGEASLSHLAAEHLAGRHLLRAHLGLPFLERGSGGALPPLPS